MPAQDRLPPKYKAFVKFFVVTTRKTRLMMVKW